MDFRDKKAQEQEEELILAKEKEELLALKEQERLKALEQEKIKASMIEIEPQP